MKIYEVDGTPMVEIYGDVKKVSEAILDRLNSTESVKMEYYSFDLDSDINKILTGKEVELAFLVNIGVYYRRNVAFQRVNYKDKNVKEVKEIIRERVSYLFESIDDIIVDAETIQREAIKFNPIPKRYRKK